MSLLFMIRSSSPSIFTSVPDHLPNRTRSPFFTLRGTILPISSRARADSDDLGPRRLLFGCVRNDDATGRFHVLFNATHNHAVVQRAKLHGLYLGVRMRIFLESSLNS